VPQPFQRINRIDVPVAVDIALYDLLRLTRGLSFRASRRGAEQHAADERRHRDGRNTRGAERRYHNLTHSWPPSHRCFLLPARYQRVGRPRQPTASPGLRTMSSIPPRYLDLRRPGRVIGDWATVGCCRLRLRAPSGDWDGDGVPMEAPAAIAKSGRMKVSRLRENIAMPRPAHTSSDR
jgi:hypothetical protein